MLVYMILGCARQALAGGAAGAIKRVGWAHLQGDRAIAAILGHQAKLIGQTLYRCQGEARGKMTAIVPKLSPVPDSILQKSGRALNSLCKKGVGGQVRLLYF